MTVTTIPINDPKAPTLKQANSAGSIFKKILVRAFLIAFGINLFFSIFSKSHHFFLGFIVVLFPVLGALVTIALYKVRFTQNRKPFVIIHDYYKAHAVANGFNVSFENPGILVDTQAKKIIFTIDPFSKPQYLICDYTDIQAWQAHRDDITQNDPVRVNMTTGQVQGGPRLLMTAHLMTVNIKYPESPRQMFWTGNEADSGLWSDRLNALVNG